ncbi:Mks1p NDAI_0F02440 [Naumovozyma dairenensis CBS 421]|uniref:Nitrogen regulatory protein areA GATA-like domain-containing protein n=1 Tax=Naumovozyma dairenensis (strain ATCC 10597 / BCRC 20456 / CBS 421 / NBRC 0211 / NRRL Y-12639) TaxID=1071378 RepID=G0WCQ1_NAUDC|nr:hypothetical protein NDAI_0F02440 [Naumovozyma dairenensis CBS 421]CCD25562.1 hypothetical protein NDAI_0F02440 [Naumovozyma dairenensis CBS 421]
MSSDTKDINTASIPKRLKFDDENKFLKVTPNLFTPERLHLFDSIDLYTSLITCSKFIEQGERLHNLSWRIMNKALLKNHNINRSKKRDGVKNIYYVLNPVKNPTNYGSSSSSSSSSTARANNTIQVRSHTQVQPQHAIQTRLHSESNDRSNRTVPTSNKSLFAGNTTALPKSREILLEVSPLPNSASTSTISSRRTSIQPVMEGNKQEATNDNTHTSTSSADVASIPYKSSTGLFSNMTEKYKTTVNNDISHNNGDSSNTNHSNQGSNKIINFKMSTNSVLKKENPQTIVTGFDTNTIITKKVVSNNDSDKITTNITNTLFSRKSPNLKKHSLFAKHSGTDLQKIDVSKSLDKNNNKIFFSSEDEEDDDSDWDSVSEDSDLYADDDDDGFDDLNEDEEDQYYRKQWDKLIFTKNKNKNKNNENRKKMKSNQSSVSSNNTVRSHERVRRSLLSGLFVNETMENQNSNNITNNDESQTTNDNIQITNKKDHSNSTSSMLSLQTQLTPKHNNNTNTTTPAPIHSQDSGLISRLATLETSTVNALGSVSPPRSSDLTSTVNLIKTQQEQQEQQGRSRSRTRTTTKKTSRPRTRRTESFSSIVSEATGERYLHESNAPPTAQTILPTALATHMFLPNNIHQQRMAANIGGSRLTAARLRKQEEMTQREERNAAGGGRGRAGGSISGSNVNSRRESMDIPSKSRNAGFLKTRMEISEEEKIVKDYNRRKQQK